MQISQRAGIIGAVLVLVLLGGLWAFSPKATAPEAPAPMATSTPVEVDAEEPDATSVLVRAESTSVSVSAEVNGTATLIVDGTTYQLTAPEGATLKDAMDRLQMESTFTYSFRNYSGLGALVTAINGRASTGDMVWILYVNGEKSSVGISAMRIRSGDVIEWKLEESY